MLWRFLIRRLRPALLCPMYIADERFRRALFLLLLLVIDLYKVTSSVTTPFQRRMRGCGGRGLTLAIHVGVLAEAILHVLESVDAVHAFGFGLGEDKA